MSDIHTHTGMDGEQVTRYTPGQPSRAPADIPRVTIGNIQGVSRYEMGSDSESDYGIPLARQRLGIQSQAPQQANTSRVHTGHVSFVNGVQQGPESTVTRQTAADLAPAQGGILATLQNNAGSPTSTISPSATVELPGMGRTSVKVAATLGFLTLTSDGRYVEAGRGNAEGGLQAQGSQEEQQAANTQEQQQQGDEGPALFGDVHQSSGMTGEEIYGGLIEPIQQATYDSMLASATAHLAQDGDLDGLIGSLTSRYGSDITNDYSAFHEVDIATDGDIKERAAAVIKSGAEMWQRQADQHVKAAGIVPADFYQWARESNPDALKQAIQGQLFGRSLKGYSDLMESYFDNVPPTLEALQRGGIPTKEQGGTVFVQLGGTWMTLQAAVKARMV